MRVSPHTAQASQRPRLGIRQLDLPELPSQYASAVVAPVVRWIAIRWHPNVLQARTHRSSAWPRSSFALPPWSRFHKLSCEVRPVGRGLTFVPGDVATRIRTITIRPSLLPTSQARTAKDRPCGLLSPKGAIRGFDVPSVRVHRVRCLLLTGGSDGSREQTAKPLCPSPLPFGSSVLAISACR